MAAPIAPPTPCPSAEKVSSSLAARAARIAGWHGSGMLDWPGRMATTLFVTGCNLRCPYCHNSDILAADSAREGALEGLLEHVHARRSWIDGVVVTGGEPTLDPALFALLDKFAALCLPVKLDTNGTNPSVLRSLLDERLVAYVALDVKTVPARYADVTGVKDAWARVEESVALLFGSCIPHEFRTTVFPRAVSLDELPEIASMLRNGDHYVLQQFRPQHTLDPSAEAVHPYFEDDLVAAAQACSRFLPTTVRGV
ncbi:MAG: anaerobic ribonucleoside-triphosphate reductase activating protein [Coriobacteriia bacterium]|nr:anaerobic ribonucleoside-triphosphate reductase activating protein [Coriobacteriia bacterium]